MIVLAIVWSFSAIYVLGFIDRGWIPHDDGSLAQMAERVLEGELPHRDFDEIYTGGLSFLYAAAFKVLGLNLVSIRIVLYIFFLAFVPALYAIALRFASPPIAGAVTLLGVVWSVPNYFAGLPSWYNLFFATYGTLALIRHVETQHRSWLFIAGVCGGLSFLAKLTGIYYLAGGVLFLMYSEQALSSAAPTKPINFASFLILKGCLCLGFIISLITVLRPRLGAMEIFHFVLPAVVICWILLWSESRAEQGNLQQRFQRLLALLIPFCLGAVIPVAFFLLPYLLSGSLTDFYQGVFVLSQNRLECASKDFPPVLTLVAAIPYALLLSVKICPGRAPVDKVFTGLFVLALGSALIWSDNLHVYQFIWQSARALPVIAVMTGCLMIARSYQWELTPSTKRQILLLLVIMTALVSLVQFPFAAPIYFCYIAPFVALTLLAVVSIQSTAPKPLHLGIMAFYLLFAVLWMNTGYVVTDERFFGLYRLGIGAHYSPYRPRGLIDIDRGGIRVPVDDQHLYNKLVSLARTHRGSGYIYAGPDSPEVYFLSGLRNPTRKIFDFLSDTPEDTDDISVLLEVKGVELVVINRTPPHSKKIDPAVLAVLQDRFPRSLELDRFTVRWIE